MSAGKSAVAVVLDARQNEIYSALYDCADDGTHRALIEDGTRKPDEFRSQLPAENLVLVGDGSSVFGLEGDCWLDSVSPDAAMGLLMVADRMRSGESDDLRLLNPAYHRITEAERQARLRRQ